MKKLILLALLVVTLSAQAYEPMIREDRIWEYCIETVDWDISSKEIVNFKFDGTERINGQTYHKLNLWDPDAENPAPVTVAYMREGNGSVYLLLQQETICMYGNGGGLTLPLPENTEICLYRFESFEDGIPEAFPLMIPAATTYHEQSNYDAKLDLLPLQPLYKQIRANGKDWNVTLYYSEYDEYLAKRWLNGIPSDDIRDITIVEGIGNVGRGFLCTPGFLDIMITNQDRYAYFVRQKDVYGNTVFDAKWVKDQSGVTEIVPQERPKDGRSYDLTGKQVNDPEPGTIYIQDGEKRIAR